MSETKEWYTVNEAASYLGISRRTVYKLCETSRLPTYAIGVSRTRRFRKEDLDKVPARVETSNERVGRVIDPALAALWDNEKDAEYDKIYPR